MKEAWLIQPYNLFKSTRNPAWINYRTIIIASGVFSRVQDLVQGNVAQDVVQSKR